MPDKARRPAAGTVLAFDFGLHRIGVAVGEPELGTAHALPALVALTQPGRMTAIERLLKEWRPSLLVVGRPLGEDRAPHEMTRRAERFARQLEGRFRLPVERVDERYTSVAAESLLRGAKKKAVDSVAAQLILEQYFHGRAA